jgi:Protein of unknown function (DUF3995)
MNVALASVLCLVFVTLALWHFRMALWPTSGASGAVPSVGGKPLFVPSPWATGLVGVVLLLFAWLVGATAGLVEIGISVRVLSWLCDALALGLLARAIGEFK